MSFFKPEILVGFFLRDGGLINGGRNLNREQSEILCDFFNYQLKERGVRVFECGPTFAGTWRTTCPVTPGTHQALLVGIEELPKKECIHEKIIVPYNAKFKDAMENVVCAECHKMLRIGNWEVVK